MKFKSCSFIGPKVENQDAILAPFEVNGYIWCAVADGVGSSTFGGLAARTCLELIQKVNSPQTMGELFEQVRTRLIQVAKEQELNESISTTLSVLCINGDQASVGHVGDTRISHYRGKGVVSRTKDQTEVQKLLDDGVLTKS